MTTITLTDAEIAMATTVGNLRSFESRSSNRSTSAGLVEKPWDIDFQGAAAELAYCKFRGLYWDGSVCSFKEPDAPNNVQIRSTKHENGCLIIRENDNVDHYYVLVVGEIPNFKMIGWIKGTDGRNDEYKKKPNGRPVAWFIPQSKLKSLK